MENSVSDNRQILLVSSDSFIEGLVRGYCLAYCLNLEVRRFATAVVSELSGSAPRLLIVDGRDTTRSNGAQAALSPETLYALRQHAQTSLCIISDSADVLAARHLRDHDHIIGEPLAEQLDQCLRQYTGQNPPTPSERRRQNRRGWRERREWIDRRRGAQAYPRAVTASRRLPLQDVDEGYCLGPFAIDPASREVTLNGQMLYLSTKEFQLFHLLASNAGKVLAADAIIVELWPESSRANKSDLYQYIHLLRRKIESDYQCPRWLVTVKGVGYRFCASPAAPELSRSSNQ